MDKTAQKTPEVIDGADFNPANYAGRDVVFVKVPRSEGIGRELNFFGLRLRASVDDNPLIVGTGGAAMLAWEALTTRMTIGKMLLTDDEFAKSFRGGALMDIREKHLDDFTRYYSRESSLTQAIPDMVNRYKLQWNLGSEVKARGVGTLEAMSKWRWGHWVKVAGSIGAIGVGFGLLGKPDESLENAQMPKPDPSQLLDPQTADWRGKVFGVLGQSKE